MSVMRYVWYRLVRVWRAFRCRVAGTPPPSVAEIISYTMKTRQKEIARNVEQNNVLLGKLERNFKSRKIMEDQ